MVQKNTILQETSPTITADQFLETATHLTDKLIVSALDKIKYGRLTIVTPNGVCIRSKMLNQGPEAIIYVHHNRFINRVFSRGDIGLGESYIDGDWETPDLYSFLLLCAMNADEMGKFADGNFFQRIIWRFVNSILRRNSKSGSRRNIMAHYDVGNDFYSQWLDKTMTYSSAIFNSNDAQPLEEAQNAKYQRMLDQLPEDTKTILEIGCGWGGFTEYAVNKGYKVTAVTISPAQYEFAQKRIGDKATILLRDYRDIQGEFDAIISIEMFEAVGEQYWGEYFTKVQSLLKEGGKAVIQSITVRDDLFNDYRKRNDFIRCYTFPGGILPSVTQFKNHALRENFISEDIFLFGQDYDKTLRIWLENMSKIRHHIIRDKGIGFYRSWEFYMALCAAGFGCGRINVAQFTLAKNNNHTV